MEREQKIELMLALDRFARCLKADVGLMDTLAIVMESAGDQAVVNGFSAVHDAVIQGRPVAPVLKNMNTLFPGYVASMWESGELGGGLDDAIMGAVSILRTELEYERY